MKLSCRNSGINGFINRTISAVATRGALRVDLRARGPVSPKLLASKARKAGLTATTFGENIVVLGKPRN